MERAQIKSELCMVLKQIQDLSGEECPTLTGDFCPADNLPKFDSKVWPVAAGMLGTAIGVAVPPEMNLFVDDATKAPLTIDQAVERVFKLVHLQAKDGVA